MIAITTKYEPGSMVWTMINNKPIEARVEIIAIRVARDVNRNCLSYIDYELTCDAGRIIRKEADLCSTKEELKQHVFGEFKKSLPNK